MTSRSFHSHQSKGRDYVEDNTPYISQDHDRRRRRLFRGRRQPAGVEPVANEKPNVVCIGVGGKGAAIPSNAAKFGNVIAICDVDRNTLDSKGKADGFKDAEKFTDYRELFAKYGKNIESRRSARPITCTPRPRSKPCGWASAATRRSR